MHDTRLRHQISPSIVCCCACALSCADGWRLRVCVPQAALLVKPTIGTVPGPGHMQKKRLEFMQVRPRTGIDLSRRSAAALPC